MDITSIIHSIRITFRLSEDMDLATDSTLLMDNKCSNSDYKVLVDFPAAKRCRTTLRGLNEVNFGICLYKEKTRYFSRKY